MRLLIITPFKNEEASIGRTIASIVKQSTHPVKWIMVDDGSDDSSAEVVKGFQRDNEFIHYHLRSNSAGVRATGNNVVDVFNAGLKLAGELNIEWDIVAKLDADLVIQRDDYLQFLLGKFEAYPKLGIASGVTYILSDQNEKKIESKHKWHTQGPNKFYRKACFEAIGGLRPFKGWDGVDDILARSKGFITEKFFEQEVMHLYPTQTRSAEGGFKKGLLREAQGYRNMGYPFYMYVFKSLKLTKERGVYSGLMYFLYGVKVTLGSKPKVNESEKSIVRSFMARRWKNKFSYTGDIK
jgi:glycosyltransferase involved in cell wall biosynthesis